jgi:hypothetical protein
VRPCLAQFLDRLGADSQLSTSGDRRVNERLRAVARGETLAELLKSRMSTGFSRTPGHGTRFFQHDFVRMQQSRDLTGTSSRPFGGRGINSAS